MAKLLFSLAFICIFGCALAALVKDQQQYDYSDELDDEDVDDAIENRKELNEERKSVKIVRALSEILTDPEKREPLIQIGKILKKIFKDKDTRLILKNVFEQTRTLLFTDEEYRALLKEAVRTFEKIFRNENFTDYMVRLQSTVLNNEAIRNQLYETIQTTKQLMGDDICRRLHLAMLALWNTLDQNKKVGEIIEEGSKISNDASKMKFIQEIAADLMNQLKPAVANKMNDKEGEIMRQKSQKQQQPERRNSARSYDIL